MPQNAEEEHRDGDILAPVHDIIRRDGADGLSEGQTTPHPQAVSAGGIHDGPAGEAPKSVGQVLCEICQQQPAKYRCPGCEQRSCSLACTREHKSTSGAARACCIWDGS
jgi:hypothetical protein